MKQQLTSDSKELESVIEWLSDEYDFDEIENMLSESKIYKENNIITIQYSNGVIDTFELAQ